MLEGGFASASTRRVPRAMSARERKQSPKPKTSLPRRLLGLMVRTTIVFLVFEVLLRVVAFVCYDFSTYYLLYGMHQLAGRVGISPWSVYDGSHFKFPPDYVLEGAAGQGEDERATTNSLGFRGPDFDPQKPADAFRVVCMGGSSTFGFHDSDDGTYPIQLERLLREQLGTDRIEVLNAGFPYYNSGSILSLLRAEVLDYEPDVLLLYCGYNDASWPLRLSVPVRAVFWLQQHSICYFLLKEAVLTDQRIYQVQHKVYRELARETDAVKLQADTEAIADRFRTNLTQIVHAARDRGVHVILIRQAVSAMHQHEEFKNLTYEQEYQAIVRRLEKGEFLSVFDTRMIYHHRLMEELEAIGRTEGLEIVDNIALIDANREGLASWVHLTEAANGRLAALLARSIAPLVGAPPGPPPGR